MGQRKRSSAELKTKVALEAIKGHKTANEIAAEYGVHPTQIVQWKKQALDGLPTLFSTRASEHQKSEEELIATLYQQIGHVIRAGGLVGKKIKSTPLRRNERSLSVAASGVEHRAAMRAARSGPLELLL